MVQLVRSDSPDDARALAPQLAQALRTARLTVLVGTAGAGKSTLLTGVLPLLHRRATDRLPGADASSGVVVPFPDRRARGAEGVRSERIHTLGHWDDASMQTLQRALDDDLSARARRTLADALTPGNLVGHIERHGGARLLFVFDHFEELLDAMRGRIGLRRLVDTWAAAARSPQLKANFLVAVDERAWPWLHALCTGLPSGSWSAWRLHAPQGARVLEPMAEPRAASRTLTRAPVGLVHRPSKSATGRDFLDSVNARVRRVAESAREQQPGVPPVRKPTPSAEPHAPIAGAPAVAEAPAPETLAPADLPVAPTRARAAEMPAAAATPTPARRRRPVPALAGLGVLVLGAAIAAWWWRAQPDAASAAASAPVVAAAPARPAPSASVTAQAATTAATAPAAPVLDLIGVAANGEHARIARELVGTLPGDGAVRVEALARETDPVAWLQQAPGRLGIAHWDALRAAAHKRDAAPLQVLSPLFAEPVLFVARADSPLRTLRQLQGKRINVGPTHSDAAVTVRELLRRLHGVPPGDIGTLTTEEAVAELVAFGSFDAIAVVDAQPMAWWRTLDPAVARRLRVLTLDPTNERDQRLLDAMGTQPLHVSLPGAQGGVALVPAVMSYLVASGDADPERLGAMAQALCRELPQLQKQGHPAWRDLRPRAQTDTGWPVVGAFRSTLSRCVRS